MGKDEKTFHWKIYTDGTYDDDDDDDEHIISHQRTID